MPPPEPSESTEFSEGDEAYLRSCLENYRSTPTKDKERFRLSCVKHILATRGVQETVFVVHFFHSKVRNWLQNHSRKLKLVRFPGRVNQGFSAERAFAFMNADLIRQTLNKRQVPRNADDASDAIDDPEADDEEDVDEEDADEEDAEDEEDEGEDEDIFGDGDLAGDDEDGSNTVEKKAYIVTWNATVRRLWNRLDADERLVYERLALKWSQDGPAPDVKCLLAEKRAPAWMRSVSHLFWTQCDMPIIIYGMYKDKDGGLHAAVYDTTNLWHETDKTTPLLRNVPGWDEDFRRTTWNFFQATLRPDLASPDQLQVMQASRREPSPPFEFQYYDDGCPILADKEHGKGFPNSRRQEIFRDYLNIHYNLAAGCEKRSAPWTSLRTRADKFFDDGMLPENFSFQDPSKINEDMLKRFFTHVIDIEHPKNVAVEPERFRFSHYETGSGENRTYHPAVYNGIVEPSAPRRTKKTVTVPAFEGPPPTPDDSSPLNTPNTGTPAPQLSGTLTSAGAAAPAAVGPSPQAIAMDADLQAIRAAVMAEKAAGSGPSVPNANSRRRATAAPPDESVKGKTSGAARRAANPARTPAVPTVVPALLAVSAPSPSRSIDELPATEAHTTPGGSPDGSRGSTRPRRVARTKPAADTNENTGHGDHDVDGKQGGSGGESSISDDDPYVPDDADGHEASDDEVEEFLNVELGAELDDLVDSPHQAIRSNEPAGVAHPPLLAPVEVAPTAEARREFLLGLADDREYVELVARVDRHLRNVISVRGQMPVFWGTWGHKSAHIPAAVQTNVKKWNSLCQWISKGRDAEATSEEVQRFCLVVGITLRDLQLVGTVGGTSVPSGNLPAYMVKTRLDSRQRADVLLACVSAFKPALLESTQPVHSQKGKRKAKAKAVGTTTSAGAGTSSAEPSKGTGEPAKRRSTRSTARNS